MGSNSKRRTHCQETHIFCSTGNKCMGSQTPGRLYLKSNQAGPPRRGRSCALPLPCESRGDTSITTAKSSKVPARRLWCGIFPVCGGGAMAAPARCWQEHVCWSQHEHPFPKPHGTSHDARACASPCTARAASSPPGASCSCMHSVKLLATASALDRSQWESLT